MPQAEPLSELLWEAFSPMVGTLTNSLSISKIQRERSVKQAAAIAHDLIRKIAQPYRSQIIQELIGLGFSEIEASQGLRSLEDNHEIFIVEDSGILKVLLYRNIISPEFEREQKQLQDRWLKAREEGEW